MTGTTPYTRGALLYEGKAKRVYEVQDHPDLAWLEYKDSLTAFNAQKKGSFAGKGDLNCEMATRIFSVLESEGIRHHIVQTQPPHDMVVKRLQMIPLEVVVRNVIAGSLAKRFGLPEGDALTEPLVEFYYKNDTLQDPFVSDDQIRALKLVDDLAVLDPLKQLALKINQVLKRKFAFVDITLVDFKLEFGRLPDGTILLADEITPDSCRLWDTKTNEKLDKDRFRRDLGKVDESYREVAKRIQTWTGG